MQVQEKKTLRSGYTTGTCAAAAAGAAMMRLAAGTAPPAVEVELPSGERACLTIEEEDGGTFWASCAVQKDAGDDPDVTNGTFVYARISRLNADCSLTEGDAGVRISDLPCYIEKEFPGLYVTGGEGIGMVTKEGLSCPPGSYAINPVPRRMILRETDRMRKKFGLENSGFLIEISIPAGKELAEKTFNPKLGIVGGISVLGTTGIVNPMSEEALLLTIRLEIRVRAAEGRTLLAMAPGNYGEAFLREKTGLSLDSFVKCSNFIGDTVRMMREEGIRRVLLAGHQGKLIKVAAGVLNTHSRYGDGRMESMAACALEAGMSHEAVKPLYGMNTTDEAADYLLSLGMLKPVMEVAARKVKYVTEKAGEVETEVILFSGRHGFLAQTDGANAMIRELKERDAFQMAVQPSNHD